MQESSCRRDRVTFFVVLASVFVANLAYNMLTTALPSVMADFEIDAIAGQLLTTGYVYAAPRTSLLPSSSANGATPTPSSSRRAPAMPVMPRISSWPAMWAASPQLTTSFLSTPWWSSTSRTGMRSTASMHRRSSSVSPRMVRASSAPSIRTSCSRTPSSNTPPMAAIGCKGSRPCPGSQGESGPRARFSFAVAWGWRALRTSCGVNAPSGGGLRGPLRHARSAPYEVETFGA